ncbi:Rho termination factor N-terminal domain-containing protein [Vulcanococcus sp. Clear-D1]|uniref:Rho termination factor N-terminal domain-containing protein n=1 Tax=Vulcanococcus sp. Clear-D1 TaxID=2766970 RepID=UPI0025DC81D1|nr:Rho termination factor N-terminal domain-containing protein [Vulcanococcus sp. Clear-D1]
MPHLFPITRVDPKPQRQLHPLPRGLVELYGLLAVLFVLVPEWMADGALAGLRAGRDGSDLPMTTSAWQRIPELRLASMNLMELRDLARALRLWGYSSLNREQLTVSLLRKIQARRGKAL